jgi:hypothetical protein
VCVAQRKTREKTENAYFLATVAFLAEAFFGAA